MKSNIKLILAYSLIAGIILTTTGCEFDNFDAPQSELTGRVVFDNNPLSVRTNGVELEIWQRGFELFQKIPLHVAPDGTFSAKIFDGEYQLTQRNNNGPWVNSSDTLNVTVRGSTVVDFDVTPFFVLGEPTISRSGNDVTANFSLRKIASNAQVELVGLYLGTTYHTDRVRREHALEQRQDVSVEDLRQFSISTTLPDGLRSRGQIYVRIGVKNAGVEELLYTEPFALSLQ